jgi:hypothetical protein
VDTQRRSFGVKPGKVCIEQGQTQPQIRYQRDIWSPSSLNQVTGGQTMFLLSQSAKNPEDSFTFTVNGQVQRYLIDYTVSGTILLFVDDKWAMESTDTAMMLYNY